MSDSNIYKKSKEELIEIMNKLFDIPKLDLREYLSNSSVTNLWNRPAHFSDNTEALEKLEAVKKLNNIINYFNEVEEQKKINSIDEVALYFKHTFQHIVDREYLAVAFMDNGLKVIDAKVLFQGTLTQSLVSPREIIKEALLLDSKGIIITHNHPAGNPKPSREDVLTTSKITSACHTIGIEVYDHVIIGKNTYYSFYMENPELFMNVKDKVDSIYQNMLYERTAELEYELE